MELVIVSPLPAVMTIAEEAQFLMVIPCELKRLNKLKPQSQYQKTLFD